jgi:hypothetical protein
MPSLAHPPPSMASWRPNPLPAGRGRRFPGRRSRRAPRSAVAWTRLRRRTVSGCFYRSWLRHIRPRGPCPGAADRRGRLARLPPPAPDDRQWRPNPRARRLRPRAGSTATTPSIGRRQRRPTKTGCRNDRTHNTRMFGEADTAACADAPPPRRGTAGDNRTQDGAGTAPRRRGGFATLRPRLRQRCSNGLGHSSANTENFASWYYFQLY